MRETVADGLDRLADRIDPNTGLAAVAASLDTLVQHMEQRRGDVEQAGPGRDLAIQAELDATRCELTSAEERIIALEERVRARDAALSAVCDVAARLTAVEEHLAAAAAEGDGDAAAGDGDEEGDGEEDEESEPVPLRKQRSKGGQA
jgi:hypothetical protein